ncbi:initiation-control protein YabA [Philodulcilactobacillus myokoensis]|uniref:Replication initiation control protein YabA n=1 Tax=Philodulcilactobacillus myokoensis TaxID=2929573 RepID=A0A9W6B1J0_9LACO|nr:DNA replication initiation control protein YabA [Philodulcilactobacillus myokoensis]GLB47157.1 initiation-control protein YabA [Philodulcilactobacillus myokoensis]
MDQRELYEGFKSMEAQTQLMLEKCSELRKGMTDVLEQNTELKIENQHLRELLKNNQNQLENPKNDDGEEIAQSSSRLSKSRKNLEKLYNEGFHVCTEFFGQHRDEGQNCIFCTELIYRNRR